MEVPDPVPWPPPVPPPEPFSFPNGLFPVPPGIPPFPGFPPPPAPVPLPDFPNGLVTVFFGSDAGVGLVLTGLVGVLLVLAGFLVSGLVAPVLGASASSVVSVGLLLGTGLLLCAASGVTGGGVTAGVVAGDSSPTGADASFMPLSGSPWAASVPPPPKLIGITSVSSSVSVFGIR